MDPDTCYLEMWRHYREGIGTGDFDEALERAEALLEWFSKGGFQPKGVADAPGEAAFIRD